jgi:hypothetical protein
MTETLNLTVPTSWNMLSKRQLLFVCRLYLAKISIEEFLLRAFLYLANVKALNAKDGRFWFSHKRTLFILDAYQLHEFSLSLKYLLEQSRLSVNLIPHIRLFFVRHYGPMTKGYNLTLAEYIHASKAIYLFSKTSKFSYLDQLCAILYRPSGKGSHSGDKRRSFDDFKYTSDAWRFRLLSKRKRLASLLLFQGFQYEMQKAFPYLFPGKADDNTHSEPVDPAPHLLDTIQLLNLGDITKDEKILNSLVWQVFKQLNYQLSLIKNKKTNGKI